MHEGTTIHKASNPGSNAKLCNSLKLRVNRSRVHIRLTDKAQLQVSRVERQRVRTLRETTDDQDVTLLRTTRNLDV